MRKENPFSAEHPAPPGKFAGRNRQIEEFEIFLEDTLGGNSKNIAVLGDWGIGKTSLLWKFKDIAERKGCVSTIIELDRGIGSYTALLETITYSLIRDAKTKKSVSTKVLEFLDSLSFRVNYGPIGVERGKDDRPNTIKFEEDIVKIYERTDTPFLIMLDNIEEIFRFEGALYSLRNIFQMIQSIRGNIRCMLIISGKEPFFRRIVSVSEPVARFFWSVTLDSFTIEETRETILKALAGTEITFTEEVISLIHEKSEGHPYFVQAISYVLYKNLDVAAKEVTAEDFHRDYKDVINFLGFRMFKGLFESVTKTEQKLLLGFLEIDKKILTNKELKEITGLTNVNVYLTRLNEHVVPLVQKVERGRYMLFHPLFKEYLRKVHERE